MQPVVRLHNRISLYPGYKVTKSMQGQNAEIFPDRAGTLRFARSTQTPLRGYKQLCADNPEHCDRDRAIRPVSFITLSAENWRALNRINAHVNNKMRYKPDLEKYGLDEKWIAPDDYQGDCEDYVLLKQKMLVAAGFEPSAVLMLLVVNGQEKANTYDPVNDGHSLLLVRTTHGDFVMDNEFDRVMPVNAMQYKVNMVQVPHNRSLWVGGTINKPDTGTIFEGVKSQMLAKGKNGSNYAALNL